MNSFDVFDTLIARRYITSRPIFEQLAREFGIENFVERRVKADTGTRSLEGIYSAAELEPQIMAREIELEHEHAIPIQENIDRVQHGDLLISDMYLSAVDILSILRAAGLNKQVTLYQSNAGKHTGDVWRRMGDKKPGLHLGDNRRSDFEVPSAFGITCELYAGPHFTEHESYIRDNGMPNLAFLMREVRLRAPNRRYRLLFNIACQMNLPWLFITSELLRRKDSSRPKVFLGRDCQLLHQIYNAYFEKSYYLPFSRKAAFSQPQESVHYLLGSAPKNALFVDISSSGATWEKLQAPIDITAVIYSDARPYLIEKPNPPKGFSYLTTNSECGGTNWVIELFNCGDHGHLSGIDYYDETMFRGIYAEKDLSSEIINEIHAPIKIAAGLVKYYQAKMLAELQQVPDDVLHKVFSMMVSNLCQHTYIEPLVPDLIIRERLYLTLLDQNILMGDPDAA